MAFGSAATLGQCCCECAGAGGSEDILLGECVLEEGGGQ